MTASRRVRLMISWLMELRRSVMPLVTVDRTNSAGIRGGVTSTSVEAMYFLGVNTATRQAPSKTTTRGMTK